PAGARGARAGVSRGAALERARGGAPAVSAVVQLAAHTRSGALSGRPDPQCQPRGSEPVGRADATALRGRVLTEWAPAAQRGMLAAGLRHAVTKRQDVALSFEFAGEPAREVRAVVVNVDPVRAAPKLLFLALDVSREILLQQRLVQADRLSQLGA